MRDCFKTTKWLVAVAVLCVGCANLQNSSPEEEVGARALQQAEALMAGDFEAALDFMAPAYRASPRADSYGRNRAGAPAWSGVQLKWVRCDEGEKPERCEVRLLITTMRPPAIMTPIQIPLDDTWVLVGGQWYQYD